MLAISFGVIWRILEYIPIYPSISTHFGRAAGIIGTFMDSCILLEEGIHVPIQTRPCHRPLLQSNMRPVTCEAGTQGASAF